MLLIERSLMSSHISESKPWVATYSLTVCSGSRALYLRQRFRRHNTLNGPAGNMEDGLKNSEDAWRHASPFGAADRGYSAKACPWRACARGREDEAGYACSAVRYPAPSQQSSRDPAVDESGEAGRFGSPPQLWMAAAGRRMRNGAWAGPDCLRELQARPDTGLCLPRPRPGSPAMGAPGLLQG
jgi:hypothetical protein